MGARFSAPVQTGPGAHPASCTMGTGSFPVVKRPGRDVDHPFHLPLRIRKSRAIPVLPLWAMACYRVNFTFTFTFMNDNGYRVSFSGIRRSGGGVDHPPPFTAEVKERVKLHPYSPSGPLWPVPW